LSKNDFVKELKFVLDLEGRLKGHFWVKIIIGDWVFSS
jgi:hypothetical protein